MKIVNIQPMVSHKGTLYKNQNAINRQILPHTNHGYSRASDITPMHEAILDGIYRLTDTIEKQTPDDTKLRMSFQTIQEGHKGNWSSEQNDSLQTYGLLKVSNTDGKSIENKFLIGSKEMHNRPITTTNLASFGVWPKGFEDIERRILNGELDTDYSQLEEYFAEHKITSPESKRRIRGIYEEIKGGVKTITNRAQMAAVIAQETVGCPDEVKDAIVSNINNLLQQIDKKTPSDKMFYLEIDSYDRKTSPWESGSKGISVTIGEYIQDDDITKGRKNYTQKYVSNLPIFLERVDSSLECQPIPDEVYANRLRAQANYTIYHSWDEKVGY